MTFAGFTLVLAAAFLHATWNYWAKRAGGGWAFVYLGALMINAGYVPVMVVYWHWKHPVLSPPVVFAIVGSGILKTGYSLFLQRGYRTGEFSLIYPLARGTGPLLALVGAVLFFDERPSPVALGGALAIVVSIFWLAGGHEWIRSLVRRPASEKGRATTRASVYGLTTGAFIAAYTLWDKRGVADLLIAPVLFDAGTALTQLVLLTPLALRRWPQVVHEWRVHRLNAFVVATLSPLAYVLVLTALQFTPVTYVAPTRELSILIGMGFGARYLNEADAKRRLFAGMVMVLGIGALAFG